MACQEARALLDSLMGGDRNAPLPSGAAVPLSKKQRLRMQEKDGAGGGSSLLLPGRRSKSCYDKDIDPLYTAWGVDVYELFVNTKSDIGTNPNIVDKGAHEEYKNLPQPEKEKLGYDFHLFQKLQELVRHCDRIVQRNQDKLAQEVSRKLSQRGGDLVETVDEQMVDRLAMDLRQVEQMQSELQSQYKALMVVVDQEKDKKEALDKILKSKQEERVKNEGDGDGDDVKVKEEPSDDNDDKKRKREEGDSDSLQLDLGRITMEKQQILFDMANTMSNLTPLQEAVEQQHRNLNYVKSDISTDKTVCRVSGNFMSSRDADERIAAHYAGKQYVGWKLVRDKHKEMMQRYGRHGPPPPPHHGPPRDAQHGGFYGGRDQGGGRGHYPPQQRDRGGGRWERGGNDYHRRGPPPNRGGGWRR